jgi:hypothetical protein
MTVSEVRRFHRRQPFRTFEMVLNDGRSFAVSRREMLAIAYGGRTLAVGTSDGSIDFLRVRDVRKLKDSGPLT